MVEAKSSVTPERRGQSPHLTPQEPMFFRKEKSSIFTLLWANSRDLDPQLSPGTPLAHTHVEARANPSPATPSGQHLLQPRQAYRDLRIAADKTATRTTATATSTAAATATATACMATVLHGDCAGPCEGTRLSSRLAGGGRWVRRGVGRRVPRREGQVRAVERAVPAGARKRGHAGGAGAGRAQRRGRVVGMRRVLSAALRRGRAHEGHALSLQSSPGQGSCPPARRRFGQVCQVPQEVNFIPMFPVWHPW
jgi:hypothetical protein